MLVVLMGHHLRLEVHYQYHLRLHFRRLFPPGKCWDEPWVGFLKSKGDFPVTCQNLYVKEIGHVRYHFRSQQTHHYLCIANCTLGLEIPLQASKYHCLTLCLHIFSFCSLGSPFWLASCWRCIFLANSFLPLLRFSTLLICI